MSLPAKPSGTTTIRTNQARPISRATQFGFAVAATSALLVPTSFAYTTWSGAPASHIREVPRAPFAEYTSSNYADVNRQDLYEKEADPSNSVASLRAMSGLTADQLGRLFGVSRRSVQNWIAGGSMAANHEQRLSRITAVILSAGSTPEDRRRKLLSSQQGGESLFHQLARELRHEAVLQPPAFSARDLLEA